MGVIAGLSGGPPGGGLSAGGGASYSRNRETTSGSSLTTAREMVAEVNVPAGHEAIATESEYHTDYIADCEFDFAVDDSHKIEYIWGDKIQRAKAKPKKCRIGSKVLKALERIAYWDRAKRSDLSVEAKQLPLLEECKQDLVQASKRKYISATHSRVSLQQYNMSSKSLFHLMPLNLSKLNYEWFKEL